MATKTIRDYHKICLVSPPGKGKTYSFRNMSEVTTGFVNAENKPLPFEKSFKQYAKPRKFAGALKAIEDYNKNPEINCIVVDSMSAIFEMLLDEMRANFRGFDVWDNYNRGISKFMNLIKSVEKEMFLTGHYEVINIEGEPEKRIKTKGKEWEGMIEKEFTIVLYADSKFENEKPKYFFKLAAEGTSAKCPPGVFGEDVYKISNDSNVVLEKVIEFAKKSERQVTDTEALFN
jgi:Cdc6-like AAA superfamily ATPase